ncbi:MAG: PLP-dependent transferase [Kofleriaceae bacterium]
MSSHLVEPTKLPENGPSLTAQFATQLERVLPRLLGQPGALPDDWDPHATTYDLPRFDSAERFAARLTRTVAQILEDHVTEPARLRELLHACGLPYDYARLGQPLSTVYELYLQAKTGAARAFSFASVTKPWLAIIEAPSRTKPVHVYAEEELPISEAQRAALRTLRVELHERWSEPPPARRDDALTVWVRAQRLEGELGATTADAVCYPVPHGGVLLLRDDARIDPQGIQLVRKRTVAALLAADALCELERIASLPQTSFPEATEEACAQRLRGIFPQVNDALFFCTGLAAEAAVFASVCQVLGPGPVTLFFAQNGYGGTGQLITEVLPLQCELAPAPLPVMGHDAHGRPLTLIDRVIEALEALAGAPAGIFLETPTNPELQAHDFPKLFAATRAYEQRWGQRVPVLIDTTLAPMYPLFQQDFAKGAPVLLVKSGSKYFTKGKSTLGVVACADDPLAQAILARARELGRDADSFARPAQLADLREGLTDLPERMQQIGALTVRLADGLRAALRARGHEITLYSISEAQAAEGLASGLLSFYLPPAPTSYPDLVDEFVAYLLDHAPTLVKSRVSYGQSTGGGRPDWFYVINPQESTQGSLPDAVKNAQKRDNVQLCRISVPQRGDLGAFLAAMEGFFDEKYGARR